MDKITHRAVLAMEFSGSKLVRAEKVSVVYQLVVEAMQTVTPVGLFTSYEEAEKCLFGKNPVYLKRFPIEPLDCFYDVKIYVVGVGIGDDYSERECAGISWKLDGAKWVPLDSWSE